MKRLLNNNNIAIGILSVVITELLCAALIFLILTLLHVSILENARWFVIALVPPVLLLRYYAKEQAYPDTLKAVISTLFVTAIAYFWFMLKNHFITFD